MNKTKALLASLALAVMSTAASATDFLFTFSGDGGAQGATGTLSGTLISGNTYTATSGTITTFGPASSGTGSLIPNPNAPNNADLLSGSYIFTYDNTLYANQNPLLDTSGLLFSVGGHAINIYLNGADYTLFSDTGANASGSFALSQVEGVPAVPEPATWAMMLMGFGMIGFAVRSRRPKVRVTYA